MNRLIPKIKNWYSNLPIVRKFSMAIYITVAVPVLFLIPMSIAVSDRITIDRSVEQNLQHLDAVALSIESLFKHADNISRIIARNDYLQKLSASRDTADPQIDIQREYNTRIELDNIIQTRDIISSAALRLNETVLVGSGYTDQNLLEEHGLELASYEGLFGPDSGMTWILDTHPVLYEESMQKEDCISYLRRFFSIDKAEISGMIILNIRMETISRLFADNGSRMSRTLLINRAGQVISTDSRDMLYKSLAGESWFRKMDKDSGGGEIFRSGGRRQLMILHPLMEDWLLVREIPIREVFPARRRIAYILFFGLIICMLPGVFMGKLFTRFFSNPLLDLSEAMTMAGMGDLEVRLKETGGDEIGQLSIKFNEMTSRISDLMDEVYHQQRARRRHELSALQAQIHPHFLYNTLDSVCALIQLEEYDQAQNAIKSMAQFYRGALSGGKTLVTVDEELRITSSYLEIQQMRYRGKFRVTQQIEDACLECRIPKLSLQPLVENAIYHGLRNLERPGEIHIEASLKDRICSITVRDNGRGFPDDYSENSAEKGDSYGLSNIRERLALFREGSRIVIRSKPGETLVSLQIPIQEKSIGRL